MDESKTFLLTVGNIGLDNITEACGNDVGPLVDKLHQMVESLEAIKTHIDNSVQLSDCSNISPILRRILHGATCDSAIDGLAWTFGSMLAITTFGLLLLTMRAALYNATISAPRKEKEGASEREWSEYQDFMSRYYEDAHDWKYHPSPDKKYGRIGLGVAPSFDTEVTGKPSIDGDSSSIGSVPEGRFLALGCDDAAGMEDIFITPHKQPTAEEEMRTAERLRGLMMCDVIDEELTPLSPPPLFAPKKPQQNLRRTTQRKVLC